MSAVDLKFQQPWVTRAGWTLVHFLWQGSVIAILLAAVRAIAGPRFAARGRYALSCAALAVMTAAPLVTFLALGSLDAPAIPRPAWPVAGGAALDRVLPRLVVAWVAGVVVLSVRIALGWRLAARLRRSAATTVSPEWQRALQELMVRMRVSAPVSLLASSRTTVPAVVGWLRPVVLMPVEALTGLPISQVRALLAHELAHVLRHDYLVNVLQSMAEALLFYHPVKGGYVLNMLRSLMWDPHTGDADFRTMMQDFVRQFTNRAVSTEDFKSLVEKHMKPGMDLDGNHRMDWFFNDWVYGTDIPSYRLEYSLTPQKDGKRLLAGKLTQSGVSPEFKMVVPVFAEFPQKKIRLGAAANPRQFGGRLQGDPPRTTRAHPAESQSRCADG